jgi:flagella basal body P-ring formation protein FlgA
MIRSLVVIALAWSAATAAFADAQVVLRERVEARSGAVTLGDMFDGAGAASGLAVAPAPAPGMRAEVSASFVSAAAQAAGLAWTPPAGLETIVVHGRALRQSPLVAASAVAIAGEQAAPLAVRRGDAVTLVYVAPGLQVTARARALDNGALGQPIRVTNLQSNRVVNAVVTGPGAASASP